MFLFKKVVDFIFVRVSILTSFEYNKAVGYTTVFTPFQYVRETIF
jgi:hypothetical protein